ncbi:hypothetical protein [Aestuariivirga sp.]|uniref:hypothetical protein n=1 Tax=Aestuariivirga sp. TaxID=2650926 RepID=UPI0039E37C95
MNLRAALACLLLASSSPLALAAEATPDGAKHLTDVFQSYLGKTPGVVSVMPSGDAYAVKLDVGPLISKIPQKDGKIEISPMNMKLTDQGGGKWLVEQDQPFNFNMDVPGAFQLAVKAEKMKGSGIYDEALQAFISSTSDTSGLTMQQTVTEPGKPPGHVAYEIKTLHAEATSVAGAAGVDVDSKYTASGITETISIPPQEGMPPADVKITADSATQVTAGKGLLTKPMLDLLAWAVAHPDPEAMKANQAELKPLLTAAMPIFTSLTGNATVSNVNVATPIGPVSFAEIKADVDMNGIVAEGLLREKLSFSGLQLPPGIVPPFATSITPKSFTIDAKVTDFNLEAPARMIIDKMDLTKDKPLSPDLQQPLLQALLPKGTVTVTLGPSDITSDAAVLSADGSMTAGPMSPPMGSALVKLKGFDALMQAIQSAPPEMGLQQGVAMLIAAKGMAKPEGDLLTWKIESKLPAGVTINGIDPSKM